MNGQQHHAAATGAEARLAVLERLTRCNRLAEAFHVLGDCLVRPAGFAGFSVYLADEDGDHLYCAHVELPADHAGMAATYLGLRLTLDEQEPAPRSYLQGARVYVDAEKLADCPKALRARFERWGLSALATLPLGETGERIGALMVYRQSGGIDAAELDRLQAALADYLPSVRRLLELERLIEHDRQARTVLADQERFLNFCNRINNLTSESQIYGILCEEFLRRFPFDLAGVTLKEGEVGIIKHFEADEPRFEPIRGRLEGALQGEVVPIEADQGAFALVFLQNTRILLPDVWQVRHLPMSERDRRTIETIGTVRTVFHLPLRQAERVIGVLSLISVDEVVALTDSDVQLMEMVGSFAGTAIANSRLYSLVEEQKQRIESLNDELQDRVHHLADMATRDSLTGLFNFRAFEGELDRRLRSREGGEDPQSLSLVMLDIDHFKALNDTHGHAVGNIVLAELARRIERVARKMDLVCRYGGEEFAVILPDCDLEGAVRFAERVRQEVATSPFEAENLELAVTVSLGCGTHRLGEGEDTLLERTDQALYRAKALGRNRVAAERPE